MITIHLSILLISIGGITAKSFSKNRSILVTTCQVDENERILITIPSNYQYYFHVLNQSALSSSFLSLLPLSYCEQQQTTFYSSSSFAIFRSSSRFLFPNIVNTGQASSFHHHNAVLSVIDQSLSTTTVILMPSTDNNLLIGGDQNNSTITTVQTNSNLSTTTPINALFSSLTTTISNVSLFHTSLSTIQRGGNRTFNITLLIGCISASIILIVIIMCAFVKYRNRDEGSYKIDESKNFVTNSHLNNHEKSGCGGGSGGGSKISSSNHQRQKLLTTNEPNGIDSREWYV